MATLRELIATQEMRSDAGKVLKTNPALAEKLFKPLMDAGFKDFIYVGEGTNALLISPSDNEQILFRISNEFANRRWDIPFYLCSAYAASLPTEGDDIKLEVLLAGKKEVPESEKAKLLSEMGKAGWHMAQVDRESFFRDVVMVPIRNAEGRIQMTPMISDPSALKYYLNSAVPNEKFNRCTAEYPTLQDQAATYNALIAQDERLQRLIRKPIKFSATTIIQNPQGQRQVGM